MYKLGKERFGHMADGVKSEDLIGNCIMCGRGIKMIISRGNNRFSSIFLCPECNEKLRLVEAKEATMSLTAELERIGEDGNS